MLGADGRARLVEPPVFGLRPAGALHHAGVERADIARQPLAVRGRHEIEAGARPARTGVDDQDKAADARKPVLLGKARDLGIHRLGDLLGDEPARVPREVAEEKGGEKREDREIGERQLERRRADEFTERRHGSCIRRPARCAAADAHSPCRSCCAGARCGRRSHWSADRSDNPTHSRAASCG